MSQPDNLPQPTNECVEWLPDGSRLEEWESTIVTNLFATFAPGEDFDPDAMPIWGGAHSRLVDVFRPDIPANVSYHDISISALRSPKDELLKALKANARTLPAGRTFPKPTVAEIKSTAVSGFEIAAEAVSTGRGPVDVVVAVVWYLFIPGRHRQPPDVNRYVLILQRNEDAYKQLLEDSQAGRYAGVNYALSRRILHAGGADAHG